MTGRELWAVEEICEAGLAILEPIGKAVFVVWFVSLFAGSWWKAIGFLLLMAAIFLAFGIICWLVGYTSLRLFGVLKDGTP